MCVKNRLFGVEYINRKDCTHITANMIYTIVNATVETHFNVSINKTKICETVTCNIAYIATFLLYP